MLKNMMCISLILILVAGCSQVPDSELCTNSGGFWNECGSACAGKNVEFCTMQCVPQCECGFEDYTCPKGLTCMKEEGEGLYVGKGVCK